LDYSDPEYFGQNIIAGSPPPTEWVDRLGHLKRVYRLLMQYFGEILQQPTDRLDVPDLQAIAKDYSLPDILLLCKLTIAATVQSDRKKEVIDRIQNLSEDDQGQLMKAIEHVSNIKLCTGLLIPT
jgi:protein HOOK3